ncbi:phage tail tape measure protein [Hoeflea sp. Naph1]|uniref:phage tail tape measure protein n=1 Tax=Hoeflea sp. Naph1 TaxID=3388653 RepID=UPI00399013E1
MLGGGLGGGVRNLLAMGAGYVGVTKGIGGTVGAAMKFEEAFADVRKVVNGTPGDLARIRSEIVGMSKVLPVTAEGFASIYAAAGQSNIPMNELQKFSEMVAKVSVAWETSEGDTSESLAKIKNQLGLNVSEIGLYADAINHLGNNTAAASPDLVDFSKRVAANGKMFGFSTTETLAFGGAMVASGAQTEVAATSFRNMGRALTIGERATKKQNTAFKRLGLDSIKTAKSMQKNALGTTLDVLDKIAALPEWERISIAGAMFGDEARALMPVLDDTRELRRQLGLVGSESNFAGSSFKEYLTRAETTANALKVIGNKFAAVGIEIGDGWLPTIKELGLGIGDVLDTLGKRVGVLDQVKTAFSGLMTGIGYGGGDGPRALMNDLGDLIFGKAFGGTLGEADDRVMGLAKLSNRFRGIGRDLKSFSDNVSGGNFGAAVTNIKDAMSGLGGNLSAGGILLIGGAGWALLGLSRGFAALALSPIGKIMIAVTAMGALIDAAQGANSLGEFASNLTDLSAIQWTAIAAGLWMVAGPISRIGTALRFIKGAGGVAAVAGGAGTAAAGAGTAAGIGLGTAAVLGAGAVIGTGYVASELSKDNAAEARRLATPRGAEDASMLAYRRAQNDGSLDADMGDRNQPALGESSVGLFKRLDNWIVDKFPSMRVNTDGIAGGPDEVSISGTPDVSIPNPVTTQPSGTQDVRVTNPTPAPVINVTVNATTNADPAQIARQTTDAISAQLNSLSNGAYSDGAN